jgi:hypothetical protein
LLGQGLRVHEVGKPPPFRATLAFHPGRLLALGRREGEREGGREGGREGKQARNEK